MAHYASKVGSINSACVFAQCHLVSPLGTGAGWVGRGHALPGANGGRIDGLLFSRSRQGMALLHWLLILE